MVIHDTNQNSQNVLDTLSYLRYNEFENWTTVEDIGIKCLSGNMWYGNGEPDLTDICILSYEYLLDLERESFMSLLGNQKTLDRIQYMLMNKKPLRN